MPGICQRCNQFVHAAEEKLALETSWHLECFTCAVCNKTLDSTTYHECKEKKEIYCRGCYRKYYALAGYGYGRPDPTLLSVLPSGAANGIENGCPCAENCSCSPSTVSKVPDVPFHPPPSRHGQVYTICRPPPPHYSKQVNVPTKCHRDCLCATVPSIPRQFGSRPASSPDYRTNKPSTTSNNNNYCGHSKGTSSSRPQFQDPKDRQTIQPRQTNCDTSSSNHPVPSECKCSSLQSQARLPKQTRSKPTKVPNCLKCGKQVFYAEQALGYRGAYHVRCFNCFCCRKSLDSTTVNEHNGELYCKGCYRQTYGTVGVGFGVGAGTLQTP